MRSSDTPLHYPLAETPAIGGWQPATDGVLWVRLPLPDELDHVNVWLIDGGADGWTVVDTGLDDVASRAAWEAVFAGALAGRAVRRVVATHFHPDHIGLAGWLCERWRADFATALSEWLFARMLSMDTGPHHVAAMDSFYRRAGLTGDALDMVLRRGNSYAPLVHRVPSAFTRLRHGNTLTVGTQCWQVIGGGGHTPEPVALYRPDRKILIPGDQVLPRITPNISVWHTEPDADPLGDFLAGFALLEALPEDVLVLPSHGRPFLGLHRRLADLRAHHEERLEGVLTCCASPKTASEVTDAVFARTLAPRQRIFALGEALAHLNRLMRMGAVERTAGPDGADRYRRTER